MMIVLAMLFILIVVIAEIVARVLEDVPVGHIKNTPHPVLGWLPKKGNGRLKTHEFNTTYSVNELGMNDESVTLEDKKLNNRILALGDSHTFPLGASTHEAWPNVLERLLYADNQDSKQGTVYNAGVIGYSVGQYLLRYRLLKDELDPTLVLVGLSMATDIYDLIPPGKGGFVYGGDAERDYFDLTSQGGLIKHHYFPVSDIQSSDSKGSEETKQDSGLEIRRILGQFALYRRFKRSDLAMWVAINYQPQGKSMWPGMDTALKIRLNEEDAYRWSLADKILTQLFSEIRNDGANVVLVNIPYLAQVYDDVWNSSFGMKKDEYDRGIGSRRLAEIAESNGAYYCDVTSNMTKFVEVNGRWVHHAHDAHPTAEGHNIIATSIKECIERNGLH